MPRRPLSNTLRNVLLAALALATAGGFIWTALAGEIRAHEPLAVVSGDGGHWASADGDGEGRPFLGVTLQEEVDYEEGGARITHIVDGSAAEEAGLEQGDVIVGFDGKTIRGPRGLTRRMRDFEAGDSVEITVMRDGRERTFDVELGERSRGVAFVMPEIGEQLRESLGNLENFQFNFDTEGLRELGERIRVEIGECEDDDCSHYSWSWSDRPRLGVQLTETTPELRRHLGGDDDAGMLVTRVLEGSAAESAGIRVGDLIVAVDGKEIDATFDIIRAIGDKSGDSVEVEVIRDGSPMSIDVALPEVDDQRPRRSRGSRSQRRISREQAREARTAATREAREAFREAMTLRREALKEVRETAGRRGVTLL